MGTPKSSIYRWFFHYEPTIWIHLGYHKLWKPSYVCGCFPTIDSLLAFCTSFWVKLPEETGKHHPETAGQAFEVAAEGHDHGRQERWLIAKSRNVRFFGVLSLIWVAPYHGEWFPQDTRGGSGWFYFSANLPLDPLVSGMLGATLFCVAAECDCGAWVRIPHQKQIHNSQPSLVRINRVCLDFLPIILIQTFRNPRKHMKLLGRQS